MGRRIEERIDKLEKGSNKHEEMIVGILCVIIIILIGLGIQNKELIEKDRELNQSINEMISWECSKTQIYNKTNRGFTCFSNKAEYCDKARKEWKLDVDKNRVFCIKEKPILNPALERDTWRELN